MISRKLHHEGRRLSRKHLCLFQYNAGADNRPDSHKVSAGGNPPRTAEKRPGNQRDNRKLRTAGNKGCGHNRHLSVPVAFNGTGSHDSGHAAAASNQHGDKGFPGKPELSENSVHDKGNSCHIPAPFQKGKKKEKHQHLGHKAQHRSHACHNTVQNQPGKPFRTADCFQQISDKHRNSGDFKARQAPAVAKNAVVCPVCRPGSHCGYGHIINQKHHPCKNGKRRPSVGHYPVNLIRYRQLLSACLFITFSDNGADINVPLIGDNALGIIVHFLFNSLDFRGNIGDILHLFRNFAVLFQQLDREEPLLLLRYLIRQPALNGFQHIFHLRRKPVRSLRRRPLFRKRYGTFGCLQDALSFQGGNFNHLAAQLFTQLYGIDFVSAFCHNIHHIDGQNYRYPQLQQLRGQIQIPFNISPVHNIDDGVRPFRNQVISCHHFLQGIRRKGIDAGQIHNHDVLPAL